MMYQYIPGFKKEKLFLILLFLIHLDLFSQIKPTRPGEDPFVIYTDPASLSYTQDKPYYLISWKDQRPASAAVIRTINERTAIIKIVSHDQLSALGQQFTIAAANDQWKYSPALLKNIQTKKQDVPERFILTGNDIDELLAVLKTMQNEVSITGINKPSNSVVIKCTATYLRNAITVLEQVIFIDSYIDPHTEIGIIGYSRD